MRAVVGRGLLPLALLTSCSDDSGLEIRQVKQSPDHRFVAIYSYVNEGPLVSDDTRVRLFRHEGKTLSDACFAYQGDYGAILAIHWVTNRRLDFVYDPGGGATIKTTCWPGADDSVEVVPHRAVKI